MSQGKNEKIYDGVKMEKIPWGKNKKVPRVKMKKVTQGIKNTPW